jgi:hypothetical protein
MTGEMINYTYTASGAKIRQQLETAAGAAFLPAATTPGRLCL